MRRCRPQRGFTMVELMTVIVIAGVLATLALPSFRDMLERRRLEGQANELVTDLQYAKSEAVARNRNVLTMTGVSGACYTVAAWAASAPGSPRVGGCDCSAGPGASCTTGAGNRPIELKTVTLVGGATVSNGITFEFEPVRGALAPAAAASVAVTLGSRNYTVNVNANGRVTPFTN
jgi:prepilin-type N-terminal cleavage/methylation domain-containing protein